MVFNHGFCCWRSLLLIKPRRIAFLFVWNRRNMTGRDMIGVMMAKVPKAHLHDRWVLKNWAAAGPAKVVKM